MCEQQQRPQSEFNRRNKRLDNKGRMKSEDSKKLEIVDLSGMSLNSLPSPFLINLASISKLDLSNNNLQVQFPYIKFHSIASCYQKINMFNQLI